MWTPGSATRGTRKMAAEHSLRQQQPAKWLLGEAPEAHTAHQDTATRPYGNKREEPRAAGNGSPAVTRPPELKAKKLKQRKQQSTHRPPATPTRGRSSGNIRQRVYGQTTQAYSPAWGWRDTSTPAQAAAPPRYQQKGLNHLLAAGIGLSYDPHTLPTGHVQHEFPRLGTKTRVLYPVIGTHRPRDWRVSFASAYGFCLCTPDGRRKWCLCRDDAKEKCSVAGVCSMYILLRTRWALWEYKENAGVIMNRRCVASSGPGSLKCRWKKTLTSEHLCHMYRVLRWRVNQTNGTDRRGSGSVPPPMDRGGDPGPHPAALNVTPRLRPRSPTAASKMAGVLHADNKGNTSHLLMITPKTAPTSRSHYIGKRQTQSLPLSPKPATRCMGDRNKREFAAAPGGRNS
ncbi:Hypothetical predicted protein [Pelobates cultripes]|uniref:Uncharacterized protein n=1 Tax=Pelobates cultripes TaxID=61616 RepID=A0AAD1WTU6_PELCU|nr:Hypothetical predicted protein [Pelobates cultripes]